ncbi:MAG: type II secretion system F family protein [Pseudomonadota bacterium]
MMDFLIKPQNLIAVMTTLAVFATILTILMPMLSPDKLGNRMKSVALEREKLRAEQRAKFKAEADKKNQIRGGAKKKEAAKGLKTVVEGLNLRSALVDKDTENMLIWAGYRGERPLFIFLACRIGLPLLLGLGAFLYVSVIAYDPKADFFSKLIKVAGGAGAGFYLPVMFLKNRMKARQLSITQAWPDALDLCLICVESGMSIEVAFRKVAAEIGPQSVALAEELMITTAELSFLQERRQAYENLTARTGLESVKNVVLSLIQAEKYGTPLAVALRVLSQENRDIRMAAAEKKAASLPPKLTVPMMVCFLPVLFCVILSPAIIRSMKTLSKVSIG